VFWFSAIIPNKKQKVTQVQQLLLSKNKLKKKKRRSQNITNTENKIKGSVNTASGMQNETNLKKKKDVHKI